MLWRILDWSHGVLLLLLLLLLLIVVLFRFLFLDGGLLVAVIVSFLVFFFSWWRFSRGSIAGVADRSWITTWRIGDSAKCFGEEKAAASVCRQHRRRCLVKLWRREQRKKELLRWGTAAEKMSLTTGTSAPTPHFNETPMVSSALLGIVNRPWRSGRRRPPAAACFGTRRSHSPLQRLVLWNLNLRPRLPPSHPNHVRSRFRSLQDMFVTLLQAGFLFL